LSDSLLFYPIIRINLVSFLISGINFFINLFLFDLLVLLFYTYGPVAMRANVAFWVEWVRNGVEGENMEKGEKKEGKGVRRVLPRFDMPLQLESTMWWSHPRRRCLNTLTKQKEQPDMGPAKREKTSLGWVKVSPSTREKM